MQGKILEDGFIETENGEKYYIYFKNISNLDIAEDRSLIGWQVSFEVNKGVACDIVLHDNKEAYMQKDSIESVANKDVLLRDKALFRKRVITMLLCKFIFFPFIIPIFIAAYNQFLLTKQIAIESNSKKLMLYFFMSSGSVYFFILLALISGIFEIDLDGSFFAVFIGIGLISVFVGMILYLRLLSKITGEKLFINSFYIMLCATLLGRFVPFIGVICLILAPIFYSIAWFRIATIRKLS